MINVMAAFRHTPIPRELIRGMAFGGQFFQM